MRPILKVPFSAQSSMSSYASSSSSGPCSLIFFRLLRFCTEVTAGRGTQGSGLVGCEQNAGIKPLLLLHCTAGNTSCSSLVQLAASSYT